MATFVASSQSKLLQLINIPKFSDDVRLVILDYLHYRRVVPISINDKPYWLRLGPVMEDNKLFLQITAYDDNISHVLSSFGTYCEKKAIKEFDILQASISKQNSPLDWDRVFINERIELSFSEICQSCCRFTYCPHDQSTIMIEMLDYGDNFVISIFFTNEKNIESFDKHNMEKYYWNTNYNKFKYTDIEEAQTNFIIQYRLANIYGSLKTSFGYYETLMPTSLPNPFCEMLKTKIENTSS